MKHKRPNDPKIGIKTLPDGPAPMGVNLDTGMMEEDETIPTTEQQDQHTRMGVKAQQFIFSEKGSAQLLEMMNDRSSTVHDVVGRAAAMVGRMIKGSMDSAGVEMDSTAFLNAGIDYVVPWLFELGEAGGVFKFDSDEEEQGEMEMAVLSAEEHYGNAEAQAGTLPTEEARQYLGQQLEAEGAGYSMNQFMAGVEDGGPQLNAMTKGVRIANGQQGGDLL